MIKRDTLRRLMLPAAFAALVALGGCGIKGPLELPEGAQADAAAKAGTGKGSVSRASQLPGYHPTSQENRAAKQLGRPVQPDRPFVLDPLLQ